MQTEIGKGTLNYPLNFSRISDIDLDSIIMNDEADLNVAIIYYNELQVREIEVVIILNTETCLEKKSSYISSKLLNKIKSLVDYKLIIRGGMLSPRTKYIQKSILTVNGFN